MRFWPRNRPCRAKWQLHPATPSILRKTQALCTIQSTKVSTSILFRINLCTRSDYKRTWTISIRGTSHNMKINMAKLSKSIKLTKACRNASAASGILIFWSTVRKCCQAVAIRCAFGACIWLRFSNWRITGLSCSREDIAYLKPLCFNLSADVAEAWFRTRSRICFRKGFNRFRSCMIPKSASILMKTI